MSKSGHGWTLLTCSFTVKPVIRGSLEAVCKHGVRGRIPHRLHSMASGQSTGVWPNASSLGTRLPDRTGHLGLHW